MRVLVVAIGVALLVSGCAQQSPPANPPAVPVFSTVPSQGAADRQIPKTCGEVATIDDLTRILDTLITGTIQPVVGVPQDNIGRTARIDCYYGPLAGQVAKVWIGLAGYVNEESARKRLANTVADEQQAGGTTSDVQVGQARGVLIKHTNWMLVANRGVNTVIVQVRAGIVRDDHAGALLGQLADFALRSG